MPFTSLSLLLSGVSLFQTDLLHARCPVSVTYIIVKRHFGTQKRQDDRQLGSGGEGLGLTGTLLGWLGLEPSQEGSPTLSLCPSMDLTTLQTPL